MQFKLRLPLTNPNSTSESTYVKLKLSSETVESELCYAEGKVIQYSSLAATDQEMEYIFNKTISKYRSNYLQSPVGSYPLITLTQIYAGLFSSFFGWLEDDAFREYLNCPDTDFIEYFSNNPAPFPLTELIAEIVQFALQMEDEDENEDEDEDDSSDSTSYQFKESCSSSSSCSTNQSVEQKLINFAEEVEVVLANFKEDIIKLIRHEQTTLHDEFYRLRCLCEAIIPANEEQINHLADSMTNLAVKVEHLQSSLSRIINNNIH